MSGVAVTVCAQCGGEFKPKGFGWKFCSSACRNQANKLSVRQHMTAAIVPSENYLPKPSQFTDEQFWDAYYAMRQRLIQEGAPLYRPDCDAAKEKAERIAAHNARVDAGERAQRAKGAGVVGGDLKRKTEAYSANG